MRKMFFGAALIALTAPSVVMAADAVRPAATSYAAPSAALGAGTRVGGNMGRQSKLDDGSTLILVAAAGVAGYFLYDITHDSKKVIVSPQ